MGVCHSLNSYNNTNIKDFKYEKRRCRVKIVSIYDGDTGRMVFRDGFTFRKYKFRIYGVDTPEMKPRLNIQNRDQIIINAKKAKDFVIQKILDKIIYVDMLGFDKYGRILVEIYPPNEYTNTLSKMLIENKLGVPYFGGKKI
jgi:endonuclease YncB( thermonuclease family)